MNAAIRSLRYALAHPLTNYSEVPAKGFLPPKDYVRPTQSSVAHKLPRINKTGTALSNKRNANPTLFDTRHISDADKDHGHTGIRLRSFDAGSLEPKKVTFVSETAKSNHDFSKVCLYILYGCYLFIYLFWLSYLILYYLFLICRLRH